MIIFARRARGVLKARNSWAEFLEKPVKFRYDLIMAVWRLQTDYGILTFFRLLEFDHNTNMWQMAELRCGVWGPKHGHSQGEWRGGTQYSSHSCDSFIMHNFVRSFIHTIWRLPHVFQKRLFIALHCTSLCFANWQQKAMKNVGVMLSNSTSTRKQFG